ncbi:MAG: site-2 protease family protein, partial [Thermoprotei archaeon]
MGELPQRQPDAVWLNKAVTEVERLLREAGEVVDEKLTDGVPMFRVRVSHESPELSDARRKAEQLGYSLFIDSDPEEGVADVAVRPKFVPPKADLRWNIGFFVATVGTVLFAGYTIGGEHPFVGAVLYAAPLFAILLTHEFSHYALSRKHGVAATLPYFIPSIPPIGTFGAIIRAREPFRDRNQLFDIGISGPLGGFVVAAVAAAVGLATSQGIPASQVGQSPVLPFTPLLMWILSNILFPASYVVNLNQVAFAAWVGLIVTFLNAVPTAQLDGGHVLRSLVGAREHYAISNSLAFMMLVVSLLFIHAFILMALLMVFMSSMRHPGSLDDYTRLSRSRRLLSILWIAMV